MYPLQRPSECIGRGVVRGAHTGLQYGCRHSLADAFLYSANPGADELKAGTRCFAWAIRGQRTRPIVCQYMCDKSDNEEIPSANLSITCKLNVLAPVHISYVGGISNSRADKD